jgi:aromatic amino acid aminotransferase I / 2-aminoadipate transaminase
MSTPVSLGTARPNGVYFPWESMTFRQANACGSGKISETICERGEEDYDLAVALNYGFAAGSPQLLRFITEHVQLIHNPPNPYWETCLTCGTTAAIEMVFRMLCDRGDSILTEEYTYSGAIEAAKPLGLHLIAVDMDDEGLSPQALDKTLTSWDFSSGAKPRVLYTVPTGQNPTGRTQTRNRRLEIYAIAEKHDLCIIEDDPYYFLQLSESTTSRSKHADREIESYLDCLPPSYLSLDITGRVIRLDSVSKILAPGLRTGWLTASSEIVAKFLQHTEFSCVSPSGPSQVMLDKLLDRTWGHEGFLQWLKFLSSAYTRRLNTLIKSCEEFFHPGICSWDVPNAGMFLWVRVDWRRHQRPSKVKRGVSANTMLELEDSIFTEAREKGVQVSKGSWFRSSSKDSSEMHFRLTFVAAPEDKLQEGVKIFAEVLNAKFRGEMGP